jgi:hypothetical protein
VGADRDVTYDDELDTAEGESPEGGLDVDQRNARRAAASPTVGEALESHEVAQALLDAPAKVLTEQRAVGVSLVDVDHRVRFQAHLAERRTIAVLTPQLEHACCSRL